MATSATTSRLQNLVVAVREAVSVGTGARESADRAAIALRPFLADSDLLLPEHREPDPSHYRQSILHVEADGRFSVVALIWLPDNPQGSVTALAPPGDIHRVENRGPGAAISLHVYGADIGKLGSSIRRRYDLEIKQSASAWNV